MPGGIRSRAERQYAVCGKRAAALLLNMRDERHFGSLDGPLHAQAPPRELIVRLQELRSGGRPGGCRGALSPHQVRGVCDYIRCHLAADVAVAELARQVNLSAHHFSMLFKKALGIPPHQYVLRERIREAQRRIDAGQWVMSELALSLGFSDQSHFSQAFRRIAGTTPMEYVRCRTARPVLDDALEGGKCMQTKDQRIEG